MPFFTHQRVIPLYGQSLIPCINITMYMAPNQSILALTNNKINFWSIILLTNKISNRNHAPPPLFKALSHMYSIIKLSLFFIRKIHMAFSLLLNDLHVHALIFTVTGQLVYFNLLKPDKYLLGFSGIRQMVIHVHVQSILIILQIFLLNFSAPKKDTIFENSLFTIYIFEIFFLGM